MSSDCEYEIDGDDYGLVGPILEDEEEEEQEEEDHHQQEQGDDHVEDDDDVVVPQQEEEEEEEDIDDDEEDEVILPGDQALQQLVLQQQHQQQQLSDGEESGDDQPNSEVASSDIEAPEPSVDESDDQDQDDEGTGSLHLKQTFFNDDNEMVDVNVKQEFDDEQFHGQIESSNVSGTGDDELDDHQLDDDQMDHHHHQLDSSLQEDSSERDIDQVPMVTEQDIDENGVFKWKEFEGAVVRQFTAEQYRLLQIPFHQGWKRELVIRQGASTTEKKAGDVYYYPADGTQKLRSYVELSSYLKKNPTLDLGKDHFTYSKQPVWRPPDEIVRAALARGCNYVHRPLYFQQATNQVKPNRGGRGRGGGRGGHTRSMGRGGSPKKENFGRGEAGGFGRGKRKRVLPSRYDNDSFDLIPSAKRSKAGSTSGLRDSLSNGNSQDSVSSPSGSTKSSGLTSHHMVSATKLERRLNLQKQLLQQVHEENLKKQRMLEEAEKSMQLKQEQVEANAAGDTVPEFSQQQPQPVSVKVEADQSQSTIKPSPATSMPLKIKIPRQQQQQQSQLQRHLLNPNSSSIKSGKYGGGGGSNGTSAAEQQMHFDEPDGRSLLDMGSVIPEVEEGALLPGAARQPCSTHCPGKRNQMPNLMCCRCFCMFHIGCVPDGIWLENPNRFLCPNCVQPEDRLEQITATSVPSRPHKKSHHHHKSRDHQENNGGNLYRRPSSSTTTTLTDADPVELRQMSPSMSITKMPNIPPPPPPMPLTTHQMMPMSTSNSLLKANNNNGGAYQGMLMNGSQGMKRFKKHGGASGIVPSGISQASRKNMEMANLANGYGPQFGQQMQAKIAHMSQQLAMSNGMQQQGNGFGSGPGSMGGNKKGKSFSAGSYGLSAKQTASMSSLQPGLSHVYRLAHGSNGHSVVIKDKTVPYGASMKTPPSSYGSIPGGSILSKSSHSHHHHHHSGSKIHSGHRGGGDRGGGQYPVSSSTPLNGLHGKSFEDKMHAILSMTEAPGVMRRQMMVPNKYAKYLAKNTSVLNSFSCNLSALMKIFDYLDTRDILSLRQSNHFWLQLSTMTSIWTKLSFRGLPILDWSHLSSKIIGANMVTLLDFDGVKIPCNVSETETADSGSSSSSSKQEKRLEKLCTFWKNFSQLHHHLGSVATLKFGTVPMFVLQELVQLVTQEPIDPFGALKCLTVGNLIDDKRGGEGPIAASEVFSMIAVFKGVQSLKINAKNGFVVGPLEGDDGEEGGGGEEATKQREEVVESMASTLAQFKNLNSLSMTSFKDLTSTEYSQILASLELNKLKTLELGSCTDWCQKKKMVENGDEDGGGDGPGSGPGPLEKLAKCIEVTSLKLTEVVVDANSMAVPAVFESLIQVERLTLENLKIDDSGFAPWTALTALFKSLPLIELRFTTSDPFTNRALFESARDLISTQRQPLHITWTVTVNIDDLGHGFVPLAMGTFSAAPNLDFTKRYLSVLEPSEELYQISESESLVAVEISTLTDLLNRDVNLNAFTGGEAEAKVTVQIIPQ